MTMLWEVISPAGYKLDAKMPRHSEYRGALIKAIEEWLENWNREFAYHDNHGPHLKERNKR